MKRGPDGGMIGPYEILDLIGSGGMGVVYRALDNRLGRRVAIKVLLPEVIADVEAVRRFEREVRAVAALSHPNILAIYDFRRDGESVYAVMELLTGGTLRERLKGGPMAPRKAVDVGIQIARGLAAAHERNFVHRDLKPENIAFARDGSVKILDFGLARQCVVTVDDSGELPTQAPNTVPGLVLGTIGYMSPEQVRGQAVDARSDLFSLGVILHEMMTGRRAFGGNTPADTMSAILNEDVSDLSSSGVSVPLPLDRVIRRCLEKHPDERFHSASDLAFALENAVGSGGHPIESGGASRRRWGRWAQAAALLTAGLALGAGLVWLRQPAAPQALVQRVELTHSTLDSSPCVSADGSAIVFASARGPNSRIFRRQVVTGAEVPLTPGFDRRPRYYLSENSILFLRRNGRRDDAYKYSLDSGVTGQVLRDVVEAAPSPDGRRVAFLRFRSSGGADSARTQGIIGVKAMVGTAAERHLLVEDNVEFASLDWSGAGRHVAAVRQRSVSPYDSAVVVVDAESGTPREHPAPRGRAYGAVAWNGDGRLVVTESTTTQAYVPGAPGRVVLLEASSGQFTPLFFQEDLFGLFGGVDSNSRIDVVASESLVFDRVSIGQTLKEHTLESPAVFRDVTLGTSLDRQPAYSPDGRSIIFTSNRSNNLELWIARNGETYQLTEDENQDWDPAFASASEIVWSSNRAGNFEIWRAALQFDPLGRPSLGRPEQVSHDGVDAQNPTVTPDGWVVYYGGRAGLQGIWKVRMDGSKAALLSGGALYSIPDVSPSGRYVLVRDNDRPNLRATIRVIDVETGLAEPFTIEASYTVDDLTADINRGRARWSSDSRILFVGQDETGLVGIFEQDFTPGRVNTNPPRLVVPSSPGRLTESFDVSPDGKRIVISFGSYARNIVLARGIRGILPVSPPGQR